MSTRVVGAAGTVVLLLLAALIGVLAGAGLVVLALA